MFLVWPSPLDHACQSRPLTLYQYKLESRYQKGSLRAQATGKKLTVLGSREEKLLFRGVGGDMGFLLLIDSLYTEPDIRSNL